MLRKHIYFSGAVQGVGFRYRCYHIAHQVNITGWCRNLYDGRVECELQGSQSQIDLFIQLLDQQPYLHISDMEVDDLPIRKESGFEIVG